MTITLGQRGTCAQRARRTAPPGAASHLHNGGQRYTALSTARLEDLEHRVKKGRHRRFEEARALKRTTEEFVEPCAECGAEPGADHASWCLATEDLDEELSDSEPYRAQ